MEYIFRLLIALFKGHFRHLTHIVSAQISRQAALAVELFGDLCLGILTGEAHFHQPAGGQRAGTLRGEGTVAVQRVVDIDNPAASVRAYGNAAAHVGHNQIQRIIGNAFFFCVAFCYSLLIQCVEDTDARKLRKSGIAGHRFQLVHNHRIYNIGRNSQRFGDFPGQQAAQVGSVLPLEADPQIVKQGFTGGVGAARNGFQQTAPAHDSRQLLDVKIFAFQKIQNQLFTEIHLLHNQVVGSQLLGGVAQRLFEQQRLILENADFCGCGARIDDQ